VNRLTACSLAFWCSTWLYEYKRHQAFPLLFRCSVGSTFHVSALFLHHPLLLGADTLVWTAELVDKGGGPGSCIFRHACQRIRLTGPRRQKPRRYPPFKGALPQFFYPVVLTYIHCDHRTNTTLDSRFVEDQSQEERHNNSATSPTHRAVRQSSKFHARIRLLSGQLQTVSSGPSSRGCAGPRHLLILELSHPSSAPRYISLHMLRCDQLHCSATIQSTANASLQ
jgi:hypothetical protein